MEKYYCFTVTCVILPDCSKPFWYLCTAAAAAAAAAAAKLLQLCPPLCSPIDGSPPGSPIPGILQGRTLEWAAISFSNAWKWKVKVKSLSRVRLLATPWTAAYQAPLSMGFSRQEYWSGLPLPRYTYIPSLLKFPPISSPFHPSRLIQSPILASWDKQQIPIGYIFYTQ